MHHLKGEAAQRALAAGFKMEGTIVLGDYVETPKRHGHRGRVIQVHHTCPQDDEWLNIQSIPVTSEQLLQPWVSILCNGGGSVVVPMSDAVRIDPIRGFSNPYAKCFFREEAPKRPAHDHEKWQIRDYGDGPFCAACGVRIQPPREED